MQYTLQDQIRHLRQRCIKAEKENAELRANANLDKYMDKCKQEAEVQNQELRQTIRKKRRLSFLHSREKKTLLKNSWKK